MGKKKGHVPFRTCISCGTKKEKGELIRLVMISEGVVARDEKGTLPGRGAYVCKAPTCWNGLTRGKRLNRAFRTKKALTLLQP
ncbi:MAG: YlxR family protein [Deltaproteobacteria bacterium]|nr:YlxR family protein [Deltaproteobacteria bacterium]MBW2128447.1 YlxR family protein [Deltaproteobacteria bacterium]MBW2303499.1 YlxR family protein [Deltaproteobacteria bacterium]